MQYPILAPCEITEFLVPDTKIHCQCMMCADTERRQNTWGACPRWSPVSCVSWPWGEGSRHDTPPQRGGSGHAVRHVTQHSATQRTTHQIRCNARLVFVTSLVPGTYLSSRRWISRVKASIQHDHKIHTGTALTDESLPQLEPCGWMLRCTQWPQDTVPSCSFAPSLQSYNSLLEQNLL